MSQELTLTITVDDEDLAFSTNMTIEQMNFWLDQAKLVLLMGKAHYSEETEQNL